MIKKVQVLFISLFLSNTKASFSNLTLETQAEVIVVEDVAFRKLGTYRGFTNDGIEYQKTFFIQRFSSAPWAESKAICKAFDLDLISFETLTESREFLKMVDTDSVLKQLPNIWIWSDGITLSSIGNPTDWYWTKTGKKVSFPIDWLPGNPNLNNDEQYCLCIGRHSGSSCKFNDCFCYGAYRIACQRTHFFLS